MCPFPLDSFCFHVPVYAFPNDLFHPIIVITGTLVNVMGRAERWKMEILLTGFFILHHLSMSMKPEKEL